MNHNDHRKVLNLTGRRITGTSFVFGQSKADTFELTLDDGTTLMATFATGTALDAAVKQS